MSKTAVITSYSIHYTKLYDDIFLFHRRCSERRERVQCGCMADDLRITSYNVCYTKLLRLEPTTKRTGRPHGAVALLHAVTRGHVSVVQQLLKAGVNVNVRTSDGKTALMMAAAKGYSDLAKVLLDGGADANVVDGNGSTALKIDLYHGFTRTAEILREAGRNNFV